MSGSLKRKSYTKAIWPLGLAKFHTQQMAGMVEFTTLRQPTVPSCPVYYRIYNNVIVTIFIPTDMLFISSLEPASYITHHHHHPNHL